MAHIAIVGAGITGITTAYALLDCGHRVTLFERQRYAAMETSFAQQRRGLVPSGDTGEGARMDLEK
jgi:glycine/D-amino acid oxidase-like deaminating enzyme